MTIEHIQQAFLYVCDVCKTEHKQENARGHYADSRPPQWARLILKQAGEDFQGQEVADASIERLLCPTCRSTVVSAINEACKRGE